ncbi:MAG: FtsX-like permease family protein [Deltaproteobacteria bacterium]|nr:FtsX-like permease family protein [Deltaproteobacteria bacterium]
MKQTPHMRTLALLAWRNLWRNSRRTLITLTTVTLGFAIAVFFIGIGDGAHNQMIRNGVRMGDGHLAVLPKGYLEAPANHVFLRQGKAAARILAASGVVGRVSPRINLQVLASTANNSVGAMLQGMVLDKDPRAESIKKGIIQGVWPLTADSRGVVIGSRMAAKLKAKVGSKIVVLAGTSAGESSSRLGRVRAVFHTGVDDLDGYVMLSNLEFARAFLLEEGGEAALEPVTSFGILLDNETTLPLWEARLKGLQWPAEAQVADWREIMPQLVNYILVDDMGNYVALGFVLVMVAFGILNTISMSVLERTREFGLLRALGMNPLGVMLLVMWEAWWLSLVSLVLGWTVGGGIHQYFATQGWDLSKMMGDQGLVTSGVVMDPVLYSELSWGRVGLLTLVILATILISGLYPAFRAFRVTPVQALET